MPRETILQDFEILYVGIFGIDIKLDSRHRDVEVDAVEDLAEGGASTTLLYFCDVQLEEVIEPLHKFLP